MSPAKIHVCKNIFHHYEMAAKYVFRHSLDEMWKNIRAFSLPTTKNYKYFL